MKKIFLGFIAIAAISLSAGAQVQRDQQDNSQNSTFDHQRGGRGHGGHMDGGMMKELNLTDAQKQQISVINSDFKSKMEELKKHDNMSVKNFNIQKEALENERKLKFENVLTADQKNQLAQLKTNQGGRPGMEGNRDYGNRDKGNGNNRMEKIQSELGLTSDQVARMQADRENFKTKADAIKNNTSLSEDQKKAQFTQLRQEREESLKSVLTADQLKKFEEMKSKRGDWKNKRTMKTS